MKRQALYALFAAAALCGCSERQPPTPEPPRPGVFDPQLKALEAAKSVEGMLKEQDEARRRQIDNDGAR